jgi:hypothetical protein
MNCSDGRPQYGVVIHEMGHNFSQAPGMNWFLRARDSLFNHAGAGECAASLPFIYFFNEISLNGSDYGLGPGTPEWTIFNQWLQNDLSAGATLADFEAKIASGQTEGFFDNPGLFDGVAVFCGFFQVYMYGLDGHSTPHGHEMIRRFLNIFDKEILPGAQDEKVETYFAAAFSLSAGSDQRAQLRDWGFNIDDELYEQVVPVMAAKLILDPDTIFRDGFEGEMIR